MSEEVWKLRAGQYRVPVTTWLEGKQRFFVFGYNKLLLEEIKSMDGAKWWGYNDVKPRKAWSVHDNQRNRFQIDFLRRPDVPNPYARYDADLTPVIATIPDTRFNHVKQQHFKLFHHQPEGVAQILVRHQCIIAGEMGTSKTLMAMIAMEMASKGITDPRWIYVGPRSALAAVQREWRVWGGFITPEWYTYEGMVKLMKNWQPGQKAPFGVIFDESSKLKNFNSQRSQAAKGLADGVRDDWGDAGYVVLMTGSPAPKSPADWWSQCEIARPGFLKEGDIHKFRRRLGIIVMKEGIDGGSYPQLITWRNDEHLCDICGKLEDEPIHQPELALVADTHVFKPSVNEVAHLYKRLRGLVVVYFKKDCLDLPEKNYRPIHLKPKQSTLRAASLITKSAKTTISGLTLLRELSDGFQYIEKPVGKETCPLCKGNKSIEQPEEIPNSCPNCMGRSGDVVRDSPMDIGGSFVCGQHTPRFNMVLQPCPTCGGLGEVTKYDRQVKEVECPKEQALIDLLDEHEDVGRIIIFAGFTGSIDRCVRICHRQQWAVIRMDEGAVRITDPNGMPIQEKDFLSIFQDRQEEYPKVAFVAHPKSGGMGLTLTASPSAVFYSNTFDAEDRIQAEDRHHRPGMDTNRGGTIIDLIHLPSDQKILDNLKMKRDLQSLTLGDFSAIMAEGGERPE